MPFNSVTPKRSDKMNYWYIWTLEYKMHLPTLPEITVIVPIYLRYAKCSFDSRCNLQLLWTFVCLWEILSLPYSQSSCAIWREMHACYRCIWQFLLGIKPITAYVSWSFFSWKWKLLLPRWAKAREWVCTYCWILPYYPPVSGIRIHFDCSFPTRSSSTATGLTDTWALIMDAWIWHQSKYSRHKMFLWECCLPTFMAENGVAPMIDGVGFNQAWCYQATPVITWSYLTPSEDQHWS